MGTNRLRIDQKFEFELSKVVLLFIIIVDHVIRFFLGYLFASIGYIVTLSFCLGRRFSSCLELFVSCFVILQLRVSIYDFDPFLFLRVDRVWVFLSRP